MRKTALRAGAGLALTSMLLASGVFAQSERPAPAPPSAATPASPAEPAAPAQPEARPAAPAPAKTPGTAAVVAPLKTIEGVMGKAVRSRTANEDMGHIVDVLVDATGQPRAAVIDFGGFLGVGSRKVAVAWKTLDFADAIATGSVKVTLTRDQVRQAPEVKADEPIVILEGSAASPPPPAGHNETAPAH